ncbi:MAG: phosphatase PAP2 family protein [Clostridia bacterium]|nr:phosphatase PAP2 family protein [Clostridia bacterium]
MTAEQYRKWSRPFREHKSLKNALIWYNYIATALIAAAYFATLIALAVLWDVRGLRILFAPAVGFILITLLRKLVNRPRPYETLEIEPLLEKKKSGCSCPSRHTFSAFSIAVALFYVSPVAGSITAVFGAALAYSRVIAGVHFPSDVILGGALGIALTSLGLYLPLPI